MVAESQRRSFGDFRYKGDPNLSVYEQKVIAVPDVQVRGGLMEGDLLFLACDGVFDVMSDDEVSQFLQGCLNYSEGTAPDAGAICMDLVTHCLVARRSEDNITALLVLIGMDGSHIVDQKYYIPGPWHADAGEQFMLAYAKDAEAHGLTADQARELYEKMNGKTGITVHKS
jgi:serine/threonine protein phosphatase PrpC